jgi:hypothetical protein
MTLDALNKARAFALAHIRLLKGNRYASRRISSITAYYESR